VARDESSDSSCLFDTLYCLLLTDRFYRSFSLVALQLVELFLCLVALDCVRRLVVGSAVRWLATSHLTHLASPLFDTLYCSLLTDRFYRSFSLVALQLVELFLCLVALDCVRRLVVGSAVRWLATSPLTHLASPLFDTLYCSLLTDRFHRSFSLVALQLVELFLCLVALDCVRRLVVGSAVRRLETSPLTHLASPLFDTLYCSLLTDRFHRSFSLVVLQLVELFLCLVALDCVRRLVVGSAVRWLLMRSLAHLPLRHYGDSR
jgi:hypothetical protein